MSEVEEGELPSSSSSTESLRAASSRSLPSSPREDRHHRHSRPTQADRKKEQLMVELSHLTRRLSFQDLKAYVCRVRDIKVYLQLLGLLLPCLPNRALMLAAFF